MRQCVRPTLGVREMESKGVWLALFRRSDSEQTQVVVVDWFVSRDAVFALTVRGSTAKNEARQVNREATSSKILYGS